MKPPKNNAEDQVVIEQVKDIRRLRGEYLQIKLLAMREDYTNLIRNRQARVSEDFSLTRDQFKQIFREVGYKVRNTFKDVAVSDRRLSRKATRIAKVAEH